MNTENKNQRYERQTKVFKKLMRDISYKDAGEVWRRNLAWLRQGRVEIVK